MVISAILCCLACFFGAECFAATWVGFNVFVLFRLVVVDGFLSTTTSKALSNGLWFVVC